MENNNNKNGKKQKILKGASYVGAAGVGALGTMAFSSPRGKVVEAEVAPDDENDIVVETSDDTHAQSMPQAENNYDAVVAELTDEQVAELKDELRDEIRQELLHDENFINEVRSEVIANIDHVPTPDNPQPEVEVLDYATVTAPDGTMADIATMKIDGTHVAMIDVNQDNLADVLVVDSNQNQQFDQGDYAQEIAGQGVAMSPLCEAAQQRDSELLAGNGEPIESTDNLDYVNNADTTEFLA